MKHAKVKCTYLLFITLIINTSANAKCPYSCYNYNSLHLDTYNGFKHFTCTCIQNSFDLFFDSKTLKVDKLFHQQRQIYLWCLYFRDNPTLSTAGLSLCQPIRIETFNRFCKLIKFCHNSLFLIILNNACIQ